MGLEGVSGGHVCRYEILNLPAPWIEKRSDLKAVRGQRAYRNDAADGAVSVIIIRNAAILDAERGIRIFSFGGIGRAWQPGIHLGVGHQRLFDHVEFFLHLGGFIPARILRKLGEHGAADDSHDRQHHRHFNKGKGAFGGADGR